MKTPQEIQALQIKLMNQIGRANSGSKSSKTFSERYYWESIAEKLQQKFDVVSYILENTGEHIEEATIIGMQDYDSNRVIC